MIYSVQQIKYDILLYMKEFGGGFEDWYVGISSDPLETLLEEHQVDRDKDPWLYKQALTFKAARTVHQYFLNILHSDGLPVNDGDKQMDCVYAYMKSERTKP
jgi:hypothetical protein